jgi:hypothetical protein
MKPFVIFALAAGVIFAVRFFFRIIDGDHMNRGSLHGEGWSGMSDGVEHGH